MLILVIYDISNNRNRSKLIKKLRHFGLHRIQKSGFLGNLNHDKRMQLEETLNDYISGIKDSIYVVPICKELSKIFSKREIELENKFNFKIV